MSGLDELIGEREVTSPADMHALGVQMGRMLRPGDLVVLTIQSPTFVLARTHPSLVGGAPLVHVDAYRLGSPAELDDLDIDYDGSVVVVEWGRGMVAGLRDHWWDVELQQEWHGTGVDTACGTYGPAAAELEADAPRVVSIRREPS